MKSLERLAEIVRTESGIAIKPGQLRSLAAALQRVAPGVEPAAVLEAQRGTSPALLEQLIDEVTVNESFFFRHMGELRAIDWRALLTSARAAGDDRVRVWSAACAAGEEAYSLAILASEAFSTSQPPVTILGTDISPSVLERARRGRYAERALREVPADLRSRHLGSKHDGFEVSAGLRALADFRRHNLARDPAPPLGEERFDLILCRNVLIYFDAPTVERTLSALEGALRPGGQLVLGAADRLCGGVRRARGARRRQASQPAPPAPRRRRTQPRPAPPAPAPVAPPAAQPSAEERLAQALEAVNEWNLDATLDAVGVVLAEDPLNVDAYFVRGVAELACDDAAAAVKSLRRALYLDPQYGLAAFKLGRAHEALGEKDAARRAYARALKALDAGEPRYGPLAGNVSIADVLDACRARVTALSHR